jgi:aminoglycoside phosphotransferase (APT) family kinase protein
MDAQIVGWLSEVLGPSFSRVRSLSFGITSELELLQVNGEMFVLRRYTDTELVERHPSLVADEVGSLAAARGVLGDLVPEAIAWDEGGVLAGQPALLMTYLPGAPLIHNLDPVLLVEPLTRLHAASVNVRLPKFRHWFDRQRVRVPVWSSSPETWKLLTELVATPEPHAPPAFLHRDFHPGNLLWAGGRMTGIVDWAFACQGPVAVDVAHTRCNLTMVDGLEAADRFLLEYTVANPSYEHNPWWDAAELLPWDDAFSGVMAFNAFGAGLDLQLLRSRADVFAEAVCRSHLAFRSRL